MSPRRKILILLAPLAAVLAAWLAWRYSTAANLDLAITSADAIRIARATAAAKGVNADRWRAMADLKPDNRLRHFLLKTATPEQRASIERVLPPIPFRVVLVQPDRTDDYVRVTVAPSGRLLTYRIPPTGRATGTETEARAAAERELQQRLGRDRALFTFTGTGIKRHEATNSNVRDFTYNKVYSDDLSINITIETSGATVIGFAIERTIPSTYDDRFAELGAPTLITRGATVFIVIVAGLIYVIARFVRRLRENEIPLKRTLIVSLLVFVAFLGSTTFTGVGQQIDAIEKGNANLPVVQFILMVIAAAVMGALLGVMWGATEADLREAYPEKLTSIDALLGGRFASRSVLASVAMGLALGVYAAVLSGIEPMLRLPRTWAAISEELAPYHTAYPALALVMFAVVGLPFTMALLLTAVSATHRRGTTRNAKIALVTVVFLFFLLTTLGNYSPVAWNFVIATISALVLLVPFFAGDILAVVVSVTSSLWLVGSAALIAQPSASLRAGGWTLLSAVVAIIAIGTIAGLRKREEAEPIETERPEYARNITERIMLRSEMDAARQAQLRVMPRVVPSVDGMRLAAQHSETAEIGSDYFEFFATPAHVSVAVADARLPGLSSALCVSMLKGLLLNYATRVKDTRDLADRVYRQLAAIFGDDLPLSFFFGRLDRATGAFSFATFGTAPRAAIVRNGTVISLEGEEYVELEPADALVIYTARLSDMQNRDGAPLGDDALHRELTSNDPQRLVDALHDVATRHSRGVETPQSWVAVAMARSQS